MATVVYVLGSGHSGSTLLDLLLGAHPRISSSGEVAKLERYSAVNSAKCCACGARVAECPFWGEVRSHSSALRRTGRHPEVSVLEAVAAVTGSEFVIDSSKSPKRLSILAGAGVDLRVIYLTRDGRAVAYSNARKGRAFADEVKGWRRKQQASVAQLAALPPGVPWVHVRYEDMALSTPSSIKSILDWLDIPLVTDTWHAFLDREVHLVSGNRMARSGRSEIAFDAEYLTAISASDWFMSTLSLFVPLRRLGYPLSRKPLRDRARMSTR